MCPVRGIRPLLGLIPVIPQKCEGILILPPVSLPMSSGEPPEAMMAAAPPLDPPGILVKLYGLLVRP